MTLDIVGGTYFEKCIEPFYEDLFGSGLRAVLALANKKTPINFHSCISENDLEYIDYLKSIYSFNTNFYTIAETVEWDYYHPLSAPIPFHFYGIEQGFPVITATNLLYYGMIETRAEVHSEYLVYDPQNRISLKETASTFKHLALILNKTEALHLCSIKSSDLTEVGKSLLETENADVIVIKNGSSGALVFEQGKVESVPVFQTESVWPIGSGDIFSATFAYEWMIKKSTPYESALEASKCVARYCESKVIPIPENYPAHSPLPVPKPNKNVYLAGPFFSFGERFTINELRDALRSFGHSVFSPMHDAGILDENFSKDEAAKIADEDLQHIRDCDAVLAVATGLDSGTLFEIGYAKSIGKKVVVFCENVKPNDLVMLIGSDIEITDDLSTAIYKISW